jgi:hypothetical protein
MQRSFNGFSGAAGFRVPIGGGTAFVANYTLYFLPIFSMDRL